MVLFCKQMVSGGGWVEREGLVNIEM